MKCVEVYKELYHQEPFDVAFCPYRISPLGAHIDHQYGKINGLAIDKGIHMAYHPKQNGVVELQSLNFPKRAQFFVNAVPEEKQGDWADHLRGAAKMLGEKYRLKVGLSGIIEGSLPIGGLSSSASVIICFLSALCKVNGIHIDPSDGLIHCKKCGGQRQTVVPCFGKSGYFMPRCICQCQREAEEQRKAAEERQRRMERIYKDAAETIIGNCDTMLFLGGKESSTLKEISETLGKETIDLYNTSDTRGNSPSFGTNYQKTGKDMPYLLMKSSVALNFT